MSLKNIFRRQAERGISIVVKADPELDESFLENEESEAKVATERTQGFLCCLLQGNSPSPHKSLTTNWPKDQDMLLSTQVRTQTVVLSDSWNQLRWQGLPLGQPDSSLECFLSGSLNNYESKCGSGLLKCEQVCKLRTETINAILRLFWKALMNKMRVRPASATCANTQSILIRDIKTDFSHGSKSTLSPSALRRRSIVRYQEPNYGMSTPTALHQKLSQPLLQVPRPSFQDSSFCAKLTYDDSGKKDRAKSARQRQKRLAQARSPVPQNCLFPHLPPRQPRVGFVSDQRAAQGASSPVLSSETRIQLSSGSFPRTSSKPTIGKKPTKLRKSKSKFGLRLKATPY